MQPGTYCVTARAPRTGEIIFQEEIVVEVGSGATEESLLITSRMAAQMGTLGAVRATTASWSIERVR